MSILNVARIRAQTHVNGPGLRAAVWVQGCTLRCPGCFNPHTHAHDLRRAWNPAELAERLQSDAIEGISILGGEPFEQAAACAQLAQRSQELGLSVVTYSGYTWPTLRRSTLPEVQALLAATDLLIAGPFVQAKANDGEGWHGSDNQEFVYLSDRYGPEIEQAWAELPVVEGWSDGRRLSVNGIPAAGRLGAAADVAGGAICLPL